MQLDFKRRSLAVAASLILIVLASAALIVWVLTRAHVNAKVSADGASTAAMTTSQTTPSTASTELPTQPDPLLSATSAFLACVVPVEPGAVPDGATAALEQMREARASVFAYDAAITAYNKCVDSIVNDGMQRYAGVAASTSNLRVLKALGVRLHNAAVDKDQAVANQLNQQIRIFKARGGS